MPVPSASGPGLHFDLDQLLLLDWMLTPCSNIYPQATLDVVMSWQDLRMRVLDSLAIWDRAPRMTDGTPVDPKPIPETAISLTDANVLAAICPTEFRWGSGVNCGLSLKLKLRAYLRDEEEVHADSAGQTDG